MGAKHSCFSNHRGGLSQQPHHPAPVRVIAADGSLKELPASPRVTVSDVLGGSAASSFVCSSDALYFHQSPPALASGEVLRPGQIYFVLPAALLGRPLSSAEMASLAVRASSAIAGKKPQQRRRRLSGGKKVRVMPVHEEVEDGEDILLNQKLNERTLGEFAVAPKSEEKIAVVGARSRLKMKLKRALSIIQEGEQQSPESETGRTPRQVQAVNEWEPATPRCSGVVNEWEQTIAVSMAGVGQRLDCSRGGAGSLPMLEKGGTGIPREGQGGGSGVDGMVRRAW